MTVFTLSLVPAMPYGWKTVGPSEKVDPFLNDAPTTPTILYVRTYGLWIIIMVRFKKLL